jgi:hypothetical protein
MRILAAGMRRALRELIPQEDSPLFDEVNFWQPGGRINFQAWREDGSGTALTRAQRKPTIA